MAEKKNASSQERSNTNAALSHMTTLPETPDTLDLELFLLNLKQKEEALLLSEATIKKARELYDNESFK